MALSEKSRMVYDWVTNNDGENFTAADIAEALDISVQSVNGIVTSAFQRKGLMERVPAEIKTTNDKGEEVHKQVKFVRLTDEGRAFDPDATAEAAK